MKPNEIKKIAGEVFAAMRPLHDDLARKVGTLENRVYDVSRTIREAAEQYARDRPPEATKLCKDCLYARPERRFVSMTFWGKTTYRDDFTSALCAHPGKLSPATGEPHEYCNVMRKTYGDGTYIKTCGESAKWFKPREGN